MVESAERVTNQEALPHMKMVELLEKSGYRYELKATHEDPEGYFHFAKQIGTKFYPHFHFIYKGTTDALNVHIDIRMHKTRTISAELSDELQRLYGQFTILSQSGDHELSTIASKFSKQILEQSMFKVSKIVHHNEDKDSFRRHGQTGTSKRVKLRKQRKHEHNLRKYKVDQAFDEVWYISDWDPIDPEMRKRSEERYRQQEEKTDRI